MVAASPLTPLRRIFCCVGALWRCDGTSLEKEVSPLARDHREVPGMVERFEGILAGRELCNAYSELIDPVEQRARFEDQVVQKAAGDDEAMDGEITLMQPVLPGCTRMAVMEWALSQGTRVRIRNLTIDDVVAADEVFVTNSSWGVLPVVRVDESIIGNGKPGACAISMRECWLA